MNHVAYKVLTPQQWSALNAGTFAGAPIDQADGYIHLSTAEQLTETVDKHFTGHSDLIIAAVDLDALAGAIRWEPSRHGQLFPHLYTLLRREHVCVWCVLERGEDGRVKLPR
jgi:uncharacterized protein (DUF952 family)